MSMRPSSEQSGAEFVPTAELSSAHNEGIPAHVRLIQMAVSIWSARAVYAAARLGLPDLLADGPRTPEDLASATSTNSQALARLLRALASCGILTETQRRHFALTPFGAALRTGAPGAARATILTLA